MIAQDSTHNESSLYHYTSTEVLYCLLQSAMTTKAEASPSMTFRATNIQFLNDKSEYQFFVTKLKMDLLRYDEEKYAGKNKEIILRNAQYLAFMKNNLTEPSVISFCKKSDDLTMWNLYGDHCKGGCLEFDKDKLEQLSDTSLVDCVYISSDGKLFNDSDLQIALDYLNNISENPSKLLPPQNWQKIIDLLCYTKNTDYINEAECRLIKRSEVYNFTPKHGCIIPYLDVKIPIDALKSITIGPCAENPDMGILGIQMMLEQTMKDKANDILIIKSNKDFRSI